MRLPRTDFRCPRCLDRATLVRSFAFGAAGRMAARPSAGTASKSTPAIIMALEMRGRAGASPGSAGSARGPECARWRSAAAPLRSSDR